MSVALVVLLVGSVVLLSVIVVAALAMTRKQWDDAGPSRSERTRD